MFSDNASPFCCQKSHPPNNSGSFRASPWTSTGSGASPGCFAMSRLMLAWDSA